MSIDKKKEEKNASTLLHLGRFADFFVKFPKIYQDTININRYYILCCKTYNTDTRNMSSIGKNKKNMFVLSILAIVAYFYAKFKNFATDFVIRLEYFFSPIYFLIFNIIITSIFLDVKINKNNMLVSSNFYCFVSLYSKFKEITRLH